MECDMKNIDDVCRTDAKECKRCNRLKPLESFYKDLSKEARCKKCVSELRKVAYKANPEPTKARSRKRASEHPEKIRDGKLRQTYNLSLIEWNTKFEEQDGKCAICKKPESTVWKGKVVNLAVDHNHETSNNRGLLCTKCNRALGLVNENIDTLLEMIEYISKYQKVG